MYCIYPNNKHADDCYLLFDTDNAAAGKDALLLSPCYTDNMDGHLGIRFAYHMYGRDIGSLNVYQRPGCIGPSDIEASISNRDRETWNTVMSVTGNQGNSWFSADYTLHTSTTFMTFQVSLWITSK